MDTEKIKKSIEELLATVDPGGPGLGLGKIAEKYLMESTWEPRLLEPTGKIQYAKFVAVMVHRIRGEESCITEVHRFAGLLSTERNHEFMKPAVPLIPELRYDILPVPGRWHMLLLLNLIKNVVRARTPGCTHTWNTKEKTNEKSIKDKTYEEGLQKEELDQIKRLLCGPRRGAGGGPRIDRFVRSYVELGYPQAALEESQRDARSRGQLIERDSEGLPMNLRLPPKKPDIKHPVVTSSSSSGILSPITYCGRESDSPPQEFLGR